MKCCLPEKLIRGFLLGAGHVGTLCPARTQTPDSQEESRCSASSILFVQFRHREPLLSVQRMLGTLPESKGHLASRLPKDSSQACVGTLLPQADQNIELLSSSAANYDGARSPESEENHSKLRILSVKCEGSFQTCKASRTYHPFSLS